MERTLGWGALVALALLAVAGGASAGSEQRPLLRVAVVSGGQVTTSDGRIQCPGRCAARYRRGTVLRLTAKADANFLFDRWEGACIGVAPICDVALDRAVSVRARFVGAPTLLMLSVGGPGTVTSRSGLDCGAVGGACRAEVPFASSRDSDPHADRRRAVRALGTETGHVPRRDRGRARCGSRARAPRLPPRSGTACRNRAHSRSPSGSSKSQGPASRASPQGSIAGQAARRRSRREPWSRCA